MFRTLKTKMFLFLFSVSQEQNSEFCIKRCFYWSSSLSRHLHCPYYKVNELEKLWFHLCFWQEHTQMHTGNSSQYLQSRGLCFNFFNYQWTVFIPLCVCVCSEKKTNPFCCCTPCYLIFMASYIPWYEKDMKPSGRGVSIPARSPKKCTLTLKGSFTIWPQRVYIVPAFGCKAEEL